MYPITVGDLIGRLEDFDENLEVRIMSQQSWPFENHLGGVTERQEFEEQEDGLFRGSEKPEANCVFLVEGSQIRYGDKAAWEVV